jgi:predicted transcriptional regulator of viral defense system
MEKLSRKEIERRLEDLKITNETVIKKKIERYTSWRNLLEFVIIIIMTDGFITVGQIREHFKVSDRWAREKLSELTKLGLLKQKLLTGSNIVEYQPTKNNDREIIFDYLKYIERCKKR